VAGVSKDNAPPARSKVAALIVPDLIHPFFAELAKGLAAELGASFSLVIASTEEKIDLERRQIDDLLARGVDALFIASVQTRPGSFRRIQERQTPVVLVDRRVAGWPGHFVGMDDRRIGQLATEHLIEVGCRRIAHIAGAEVSTARDRLEGYRQTLLKHRLPAPRELTVTRSHGDHLGDLSGYRAMRRLLRLRHRPDGVFCNNDPTAMGAMRAILEAGLDVPGDIAVVGCGDVHYAKFLRVPLTSVAQQPDAIGRRAAELACSLGAGKRRRPPTTVLLAPTLQVRQSTARER
jgi:LacI family transcriptional regulator, galactose operon repressor